MIIQVGFLILSLPVHNMIFNLFSIVSKAISLREYIGSAYACKDGYYRAYSWLVKIWYNIHWIWRPESIHHAPAIKATLRSCAINLTIFYKPLNQASSYMLGLIRNDAKIWRNNKHIQPWFLPIQFGANFMNWFHSPYLLNFIIRLPIFIIHRLRPWLYQI